MGNDLKTSWSAKHVRRGFWGTLLISLGALSPAYLPRSSPWWQLLDTINATGSIAKLVGTIITMLGAMMLVDAWLRIRPHQGFSYRQVTSTEANVEAYRDVKHWAVLTIWGVPFYLAPPIFSHDAYSYAAQGWMIHNWVNPYQVGPGTLPGGFADQVAWVWRFTPAPYGPLSLQIQHLLVDLMQFHPYLSAVAMRLPALVGVFLIAFFLPRIALQMRRDAAFVAWFGVLNPLLVINFIGGAHNDSLMMGFVVLALWFAFGGRGNSFLVKHGWLIAAILIGVGAAIKQPAILAAYSVPLIARPWANWSPREVAITVGRVLLSFGLAIGTFALVTLATGLGFGWINAVNVPGMVITISPSTIIGQVIQWGVNLFDLDPTGWLAVRTARSVGLAIGAISIAVLALTVARKRPVTFLWSAYLIAAFSAPALHSWYVQWGGTLMPLSKLSDKAVRIAVWTTVILLSYDAINMSWRNGQVALGVATLFGLLALARSHQLKTHASAQEDECLESVGQV